MSKLFNAFALFVCAGNRPRQTCSSLLWLSGSLMVFSAGSVQAKEFFCSVDTVCSDKHPCYAIEYVWDMHIAQTNKGWVFTYDPDDGSRDVFHEIEGTENASKSLFLMRTQSDGENEQVTLFTILPDLKLAISTHYAEEFTDAETAFGSCEVME